jgi:glucose/arabinose dehydrogenase
MPWGLRQALVCALALALVGPARAGTPVAGFVDTQALGSLSEPTGVAFLPTGRLLAIQKGGALKIQTAVGATTSSTLITLGVCTDGEMGLLGIATDPNVATNGYIYLYRTRSDGNCTSNTGRSNEVLRVTLGPGDTVNANSPVSLLSGIGTGPSGNHNGGGMRIGADGLLYIGVGDQNLGPGSASNPAQNLASLSGKVLRIGLNGSVPASNPFVGQAGRRPEIFAFGFRNPWRSGIDPATGRLWVGDVGENTFEEIDVVQSGGDYSWPACEGTSPSGCASAGDVAPVFTYPHSGSGSIGQAVTGGAFAPASFGSLGGQYFFSDTLGGRIVRAPVNGARTAFASTPTDFVTNAFGVVDLVFGPDGAMYYTLYGGEVRRVAPNGATTTSTTLRPTTTSTTVKPTTTTSTTRTTTTTSTTRTTTTTSTTRPPTTSTTRTTTTTSTTRTTTTTSTTRTTTTVRRTTTSTTRQTTTTSSTSSTTTSTSATSSTVPESPPTTTTTLPVDPCDQDAAGNPEAVLCVAARIRETLGDTIDPVCGTCKCTPRPLAERAIKSLNAAMAATSRGACRRKVAAARRAAVRLERQAQRIVERGCPRAADRGQDLTGPAEELSARARTLAQSAYCAQK